MKALLVALLLTIPCLAADILLADNVSLVWQASPDARVTGYCLVCGNASRRYTRTNDVGNATSGILTNLDKTVDVYISIYAYGGAAKELRSEFANEVLRPAWLSAPTGLAIVADNADASMVQFSGNWITSTASPGYFGPNYVHDGNTSKGKSTVTFRPNLLPGNYDLAVWYTSDPNRATNVPLQIVSALGTNNLTLNEQINGRAWNPIGTYSFRYGTNGYVQIGTANTRGYVIADAVRFTPSP